MYSSIKAVSGGAVGSAALAATGFSTLFYVVASFTLVMAGMAMLRLRPKSQK